MASEYTIDQLKAAFIKADQSGDVDSARAFAEEISRRSGPQEGQTVQMGTSQTESKIPNPDPIAATPRTKPTWPPSITQMIENEFRLSPIKPQGESFSYQNAVENLPKSAARTAYGLGQMVAHPVDTAGLLGKTAAGTAQLLWPGEQQYEQYPKAIGNYYKGLLSDPSKAFEENPFGVGLDAATLGRSGVGTARNVGRLGAKMLPESLPQSLYQRGAKFSPSMPREQVDAITNTLLKEGLLTTEKGLQNLNERMATYGKKINGIIDTATKNGTLIDRSVVNSEIPKLIREVGGFKRYARKDIDYIRQELSDFDAWMGGRKKVSPRELQDYKQELYQRLFRDYAKQVPVTAIREKLDKALASGARGGIEKAIPDQPLAELNRQWGDLLNVKEAMAKSAGRIGNRDLFNLTDVAYTGAGQSLGGPLGAAIGGMFNMARRPLPSERAALAIYRAQNPTTGLLRVKPRDPMLGLLQLGHIQDLMKENQ